MSFEPAVSSKIRRKGSHGLGFAAFLIIVLVAGCANHQSRPTATDMGVNVAEAPREYSLSAGDQLDIKFFHNPELNQSLPIRPDGRIALQLVGSLKAAGLTVSQLKDALDSAYAKELKVPDATVIVASFDTQEVYVGGEVRNPAVLQLKAGMTVRQAILKSGGEMPTAALQNVLVLRDQGTTQPRVFSIDLARGLGDGEIPNDLALLPKDVVYVPMSTIAEVDKFVDQYLGQIVPRWFQLSYTFGSLKTN